MEPRRGMAVPRSHCSRVRRGAGGLGHGGRWNRPNYATAQHHQIKCAPGRSTSFCAMHSNMPTAVLAVVSERQENLAACEKWVG